MSDNQTLEVAPSVTQETSAPTEDVNVKVEEGETQAEPKEEKPVEEAKAEPTEAERIKQSMQKRIDRQTAALKAEQEKIRQLEERVRAFEATTPKADDAPKQEDFNDWEDFHKAEVAYEAKKLADGILEAERKKELQVAKERHEAEVRRQFEQKETAFRTQTADYDLVAGEAVGTMNELASAGHNIVMLRDAVMQFDNPPAMIYQLGKSPDLIQELVTMEPLKAMRELIKLEMTLDTKPKSESKPLPEPIKPVNPNGRTRKRLDEMSYEERERYFSKK